MHTVERSALVHYPAQQMYSLVEDIESYPLFLPWCSGTEVHERDEARTVATIHVDYHGLRQRFTTENAKVPGRSIDMRLVEGPFSALDGLWTFKPLDDENCKVELRLSYKLAHPLLERLGGPVFNYIANTFVDAFVKRADALYGAARR
ncbi:MAG: type II toxin-antitoxin system RatA family toxin [Burkholderiales bacterium]|nr:type II toxin-antitoxin system RatA family toxin [Burkholderiales bacterium]PZN36905.1 MAG: ubiquinone-binding protein [Pseudomonadota bacterium]